MGPGESWQSRAVGRCRAAEACQCRLETGLVAGRPSLGKGGVVVDGDRSSRSPRKFGELISNSDRPTPETNINPGEEKDALLPTW